MRKLVVAFIMFSTVTGTALAQDHPDYRSKKEFFTRTREKDIRSDLASFAMAGMDESMGKLPLPTVPMKELGNHSISFEDDHISVAIEAVPFVKENHKLGYYETYDEKKYLLRIDNKAFYGKNYGKLPAFSIGSITVIIDKDTVPIPRAAYMDICDPEFAYRDASGVLRSQNRVHVSNDRRTVYIYLLDRNAGGTEVTWIIQDKKYLKRVLDWGFRQ